MNIINYETPIDGVMYNNYIISNESGVIQVEINTVCPNVAFLFNFNIKKECRGKGEGERLLRYTMSYITDTLHCDTITLNVKKDSWVRSWYKRLGFNEVSYYNVSDEVTMSKFSE